MTRPTLSGEELRPSVGFTGTREGLTFEQFDALRCVLAGWEGATLHHGDCVGADVAAHNIATMQGDWRIEVHPGHSQYRAFVRDYTALHAAKPNLERNSDIVDAADVLVACPAGPEVQRSGTWSTVRKARKKGIRRVLVWPNGDVTYEWPPDPAPQQIRRRKR